MAGIVLLVLKSCTTGILGTIRNGPNFAGSPRTSSAHRLLSVVLRRGTVAHVRLCFPGVLRHLLLSEVRGCLLPLRLDGLVVAPAVLCSCPLLLDALLLLAEGLERRLPLRLDGLVLAPAVLCSCPLLLDALRHLLLAEGLERRLPLRLDGLVVAPAVLCSCPLLLDALRHLLLAEGLERRLPLRLDGLVVAPAVLCSCPLLSGLPSGTFSWQRASSAASRFGSMGLSLLRAVLCSCPLLSGLPPAPSPGRGPRAPPPTKARLACSCCRCALAPRDCAGRGPR